MLTKKRLFIVLGILWLAGLLGFALIERA